MAQSWQSTLDYRLISSFSDYEHSPCFSILNHSGHHFPCTGKIKELQTFPLFDLSLHIQPYKGRVAVKKFNQTAILGHFKKTELVLAGSRKEVISSPIYNFGDIVTQTDDSKQIHQSFFPMKLRIFQELLYLFLNWHLFQIFK